MKLRDLCEKLNALRDQGYGLADTDVVKVVVYPSEDMRVWNDEVDIVLREE